MAARGRQAAWRMGVSHEDGSLGEAGPPVRCFLHPDLKGRDEGRMRFLGLVAQVVRAHA